MKQDSVLQTEGLFGYDEQVKKFLQKKKKTILRFQNPSPGGREDSARELRTKKEESGIRLHTSQQMPSPKYQILKKTNIYPDLLKSTLLNRCHPPNIKS